MMYILMILLLTFFDKGQKNKGKPLFLIPVKSSDGSTGDETHLLAAWSTVGSQQLQGDTVFLGTMLA
ncbi:MAG: hypothetical protein A2461_06955 [Burkholderiales bacterium RIFOXYC2_FULL_59_8]|nr:MAG: hypothetical protein A2461_06955 [Burkholderiales bacterium RIFOXYC2_FULL_59_8]OGB78930.1 MAG: hypothetical protein A2496_03090 [Burkholderiales bacterium RIFOXYC12_FULL_60_6]OGB85926.1 MAG: hypothetical protein A2535_10935 [Burkholderiales bacterium RIFOXYD2_FULL_59_8]